MIMSQIGSFNWNTNELINFKSAIFSSAHLQNITADDSMKSAAVVVVFPLEQHKEKELRLRKTLLEANKTFICHFYA
jgi:hypothetical protein